VACIEYTTPKELIIRIDVGEATVSYNSRLTVSSPVLPPPLQEGGFTTRNPQWSMGVGKRF
jgi:hypothetical protein